MNDAKFASITSALLARKGEATPLIVESPLAFVPAPVTKRPARAAGKRSTAAAMAERKRRVVITLSGEEFQRLGIIAAKKDSTRHDLVRNALFGELDQYAREQAADCACISADGAEPCACEDASDEVSAAMAGAGEESGAT